MSLTLLGLTIFCTGHVLVPVFGFLTHGSGDLSIAEAKITIHKREEKGKN